MKHLAKLLVVSSAVVAGTNAFAKTYGPIPLTLDRAYYYDENGTADPSKNALCTSYLTSKNVLPSQTRTTMTIEADSQTARTAWSLPGRPQIVVSFHLHPLGVSGAYDFGTWYGHSAGKPYGVEVHGVTFSAARTANGAPAQPYISEIIIIPENQNSPAQPYSCSLTNGTEQPRSLRLKAGEKQ